MDNRIIKYYTGKLNEEEKNQLLNDATSDKLLFDDMMCFENVNMLLRLRKSSDDLKLGIKSYSNFNKRTHKFGRKSLVLEIFRYVAVAAACIFLTLIINNKVLKQSQPKLADTMQRLYVPAGQRAKITLPDGTIAWVNAASVLEYPSVFGKERRVKIEGEAYFQVAKNKDCPFIVSTGKVDIKALGTKFNVFNYKNENSSVALLEGKINVYYPNKENEGIILNPNQQLTQENGSWILSNYNKDIIQWCDGIYTFEDVAMKDIIRKLEIYSDTKITVKNSSILKYRYTGKFRQTDGVMEILRVMQKAHFFNIKKIESSNEIVLYV